jgi:hypothetical protein
VIDARLPLVNPSDGGVLALLARDERGEMLQFDSLRDLLAPAGCVVLCVGGRPTVANLCLAWKRSRAGV